MPRNKQVIPDLYTPEWFNEMGIQGLECAADIQPFLQGLSPNSFGADKEKTAEILRHAGYLTEAESAKQVKEALEREGKKPGPTKEASKNATADYQRILLDRLDHLLGLPASSPVYRKEQNAELFKSYQQTIHIVAEQAFIVVRRFYLMCTVGAFFTQKDQRALMGPEFVSAHASLNGSDRKHWNAAKALPRSGVAYTRIRFIHECLTGFQPEPGLGSDERIKKLKPKLEAFFGCNFKSTHAALDTLEEHLRNCLAVVDEASYVSIADLSKVYSWAWRLKQWKDYFDNATDGRSPPPPETCPYRKGVKAFFETIRVLQKRVFPTTEELSDGYIYPEKTRLELIQHHLNVPFERRKNVPD